ncbi:hypothetical protein B0H11DRAFT_1336098 [Mycena galericulata]|nr:hypothetical protein B0H11DRAFT_1336098 [Mycena galericulata]
MDRGSSCSNFNALDPFMISPSTSFLSHCQDFSIYGGTFNYIVGDGSTQSGTMGVSANDRDSSGLRIVREDEILPIKQLGQRANYSLHSADTRGTCVVVKVFHGPHANWEWEMTNTVSRPLMHPNFLRLLGRSADESPSRFLVFNSVQRTVQDYLASVLGGDSLECITIGVDVVNGLSRGLSYLELQKIVFPSLCSEVESSFDILVSHNGTIILGINPEAPQLKETHLDLLKEADWVHILNTLCRMAFSEASRTLYHDTVERNTLPASLAIGLTEVVADGERIVHPSLRRELLWLQPNPETSSLTEIAHQTEAFLFRLRSSATVAPIPRYFRNQKSDTAHRCRGYHREEILISTQMRTSYIVCSNTPTLHEICTICEERVEEIDLFNCTCRAEDDGISPTAKCSSCRSWHHVECVNSDSPHSLKFSCQNCTNTRLQLSGKTRSVQLQSSWLPKPDASTTDDNQTPSDFEESPPRPIQPEPRYKAAPLILRRPVCGSHSHALLIELIHTHE